MCDKVDGNERPNCNVSGLKMSKLQTLATLAHGASVSRSFAFRVHSALGAIKSVGQPCVPERGCVRLRTSRSVVPALKAFTESRTFEDAAAGEDTQSRS